MNIAFAAATMPPSTARTVTPSSRQMWKMMDLPRRNRLTTAPSTAAASAPARATANMTSRSLIAGPLVPVADPPDRLDPPRLGGVLLHLLAQPSHVDGDRRLVAERPAPDRLQQLATPEHPARVAHQ